MNEREEFIWKNFGEQIHQDFICEHEDFASGVEFLLSFMTVQDKAILGNIIEDLLLPSVSREMKFSTWLSSGSCFLPSKHNIDIFLRQLLLMIKKPKAGA